MTGTDPEREARRRRWAAAQLGVAPDASPEEARSAFLRRLPEEDFVPPAAWAWAVRVLCGDRPGPWQSAADAEAARAAGEGLRDEVEEFAGRFWALQPAERRARWDGLVARAAFSPPLRARLDAVAAGLDVPAPGPARGDDLRAAELARRVGELFVLRPGPRARAWQAFWEEIRDSRREWRRATRVFRRRRPDLAALLPDEVGELAAAATTKPPAAPRKPRPTASAGPAKDYRWAFYVVLMAVGVVFRAVTGPSTAPTAAPPRPVYPQLPVFKDGDSVMPDVRRIPPDKMGEAARRLLGLPPTTNPPPGKPPGAPSPPAPSVGAAPGTPNEKRR
jgi:hypothetical protein